MAGSSPFLSPLIICALLAGYCCSTEQISLGQSLLTPARPDAYASSEDGPADQDREMLRRITPALMQLARNRARELQLRAGGDGDEYHSNVVLDNLRSEIAPSAERRSPGAAGVGYDGNKLARLLARMLTTNKANEFRRQLLERKRNLNEILNQKEDKDYSFVGFPSLFDQQLQQQQQQQQQRMRSRTGRWANEVANLRDAQLNGQLYDGSSQLVSSKQLAGSRQTDYPASRLDSIHTSIPSDASNSFPLTKLNSADDRDKRVKCNGDKMQSGLLACAGQVSYYAGLEGAYDQDTLDRAGRR